MNQRPAKDFSAEVCQPFRFSGGEHGVLLLHGFTGSAAHMRPLGEALHAQGFTVEAINLPGHAVSMEAMEDTGWQEWLDAAKDAFIGLKQRCRYVSVAGLSMGGCLALLIGEQMHPTAVAAISTPMAVQNPLLPFAGIAAPFVKRIMWRSREGSPYQVDDKYDFGYPGFPTKCGGDLNRLIRMARQDLHALQCPLLIVQSAHDATISLDSAEIISRGVSSNSVATLHLTQVPHVCTISKALPEIAKQITNVFRMAEGREDA